MGGLGCAGGWRSWAIKGGVLSGLLLEHFGGFRGEVVRR